MRIWILAQNEYVKLELNMQRQCFVPDPFSLANFSFVINNNCVKWNGIIAIIISTCFPHEHHAESDQVSSFYPQCHQYDAGFVNRFKACSCWMWMSFRRTALVQFFCLALKKPQEIHLSSVFYGCIVLILPFLVM